MSDQKQVIVIGAGVTGLTSAVFLAQAGYRVTVVAAHVPGDESIEYTSPWAGAHWRTAATPAEPMVCDWDVQTFDFWVDLLERERRDSKLPRSGLRMNDSYGFYNSAPSEDMWWARHVQSFAQVSPSCDPIQAINSRLAKAKKSPITWALVFRAPSINVPQYLLYLQEWGRSLGVRVVKARLPTTSGLSAALAAAETEAEIRADIFVNATGLGAAKLCGDTAMFPIRGQTVLVRGEAPFAHTHISDDFRAYAIPRPGSGMTILGGTKEEGVWDETPDPKVIEKILQCNAAVVPELLTGTDGEFEVVSVQCGLRPGRRGGPRMEMEVVGERKVVHAYGHAGAGYQNSVGSARAVVRLVREGLGGREMVARL